MAHRALVAYGSKHGSTVDIAEAIGRALREAGFETDVMAAGEVGPLDPYDAVVVGSAVYMGRWRRDALRFVERRRAELARRPTWLFSSGPVGEEPEPGTKAAAQADKWTKPRRVEALAAGIAARDHAVFGGMVADDRGFMRKRMAKKMPEELRDRRDWGAIDAWARAIAATSSHQPTG